jgi:hypothetical protein
MALSRPRPSTTPRPGTSYAVPRQSSHALDICHACAQLGTKGLPHQLRSGKPISLPQPCSSTCHEIRRKTNDSKRYVRRPCYCNFEHLHGLGRVLLPLTPVCNFCESDHPIVHSFVTGVAYVPNITPLTPQPSGADACSLVASVGRATPSTDNGNVEEENNGEDDDVVIGQRSQPQNENRE